MLPNLSVILRFVVRLKRSITMRANNLYWRLLGMRIGRGCHLEKIRANAPQNIEVGDMTSIQFGTDIKYVGPKTDDYRIAIGTNCYIGHNVTINCTEQIVLGDFVMVAAGCQLIDCDHSFDSRLLPIGRQKARIAPIHIGRDVWLGANVVVLRGVSVGEGSVVGAGSVVTTSIPAWEVWAGVPARKIRSRS